MREPSRLSARIRELDEPRDGVRTRAAHEILVASPQHAGSAHRRRPRPPGRSRRQRGRRATRRCPRRHREVAPRSARFRTRRLPLRNERRVAGVRCMQHQPYASCPAWARVAKASASLSVPRCTRESYVWPLRDGGDIGAVPTRRHAPHAMIIARNPSVRRTLGASRPPGLTRRPPGRGRFARLPPVFALWDALSGLPHDVHPSAPAARNRRPCAPCRGRASTAPGAPVLAREPGRTQIVRFVVAERPRARSTTG